MQPCCESESYEYDKNGNVIKVTDASGNTTRLDYDSLDRVSEIINPLGYSKRFTYDAVGNITQITDEKGNKTGYRYSSLGDIIEVTDATGHSTKYDYDKAGRLTKMEQYRLIDDTLAGIKCPEYQVTTYERNKKGEVVAVNSLLGKIVKFGYDKVGNVISKLDEDGLETLYEYNLAGKLAKVGYADGKSVEFSYNALKQLTEMRDWLGTTKIELDELGRAKKVTNFEGKEVGYVWDSLGRKEKLIYPDSSEVKYEYTASGRLKSVLSETGVTNYAYDAMGRLKERVLPDNTTTKYEIDPLGRLASLTHSRNSDILDQFKYTYDPVGNITEIEKHRAGAEADSGLFRYTYDPLNRLVAAVHGGAEKLYSYDEVGNRVSSWQNGETTTHSYNARNQLIRTQEGEIGAVKEYSYDGRGNLTDITENGQIKARYAFDATNMMVEAFTAGKGKAEYAYNGFKNRIKKLESMQSADVAPQDPCKEIRYILDMTLPYDNLLMTQGAQNQSFAWGNNLISANGEDKFYYLQDHLGSPIRLLGDKENDTPLAYDEFGVPVVGMGKSISQPFGFTGYQTDDVTGLYYAQARYYEPTLGRFGAEDPIGSGRNWYGYCGNNPMVFVDPLGLERLTPQETLNWIFENSKANGEYYSNIRDEASNKVLDNFSNEVNKLLDAISFEYKTGYETGTPKAYGKGLYVDATGFDFSKGINILDIDAGVGKIGGKYEYGEWYLDGVTVEAHLLGTKESFGANAGASLISLGGLGKTPTINGVKFVGGAELSLGLSYGLDYSVDNGILEISWAYVSVMFGIQKQCEVID